jgi:NADPH:quinone reductase-like Zn-dependent oxidoreductase
MKQVWITKTGLPEVLQVQETSDPTPRSGEVRIRVEACGVNFTDIMGRTGLYPHSPSIPYVPGFEVAGEIDMVGQGVPDLKEQDKVFALTRFGGYSDVVCVPYKQVFKRLEWMDAQHGAAFPVNYLMAYLMLVVMGSLRKGDKVLIHNAGGGVGLAALDICRIIGAESYGTASPGKHEFLLDRGLHFPIDYRNFDYEQVIKDLTAGSGIQLILDSLGGPHWKKNYRLLLPTGRLVLYGISSALPGKRRSWPALIRFLMNFPQYTPNSLRNDSKGVLGVNLNPLWEQMDLLKPWMKQLITWYDEALFRPHIDRTFPFSGAAAAHHYIQDRGNIGKVLLIP